jgi:hypothetical protein
MKYHFPRDSSIMNPSVVDGCRHALHSFCKYFLQSPFPAYVAAFAFGDEFDSIGESVPS